MGQQEVTARFRVGEWGERGESNALTWFCHVGGKMHGFGNAGLVSLNLNGTCFWYAWEPSFADGAAVRLGDGEEASLDRARAAVERTLQVYCEEAFAQAVPTRIMAPLLLAKEAILLAEQTWAEVAPHVRVPPNYEGTFSELWTPTTHRLREAKDALVKAIDASGALFEKATRLVRENAREAQDSAADAPTGP